MVYQRKKRSYEPEPLRVPQPQPSLFASPELETEEVDNPYAVVGPTAAPNWEAVQRQIDNPLFDFGKISILPPDSAVQRQPVNPSTLSKQERFRQRVFSVQRDAETLSGPPRQPLMPISPIQRDAETSTMRTGPMSPLSQKMVASHQRDEAKSRMSMAQPLLQLRPLSMQLPIQRDVPLGERSMPQPAGSAGEQSVDLKPKGSGSPLPKQVSDNFVHSGYPEVKNARVHVDDAATQSIQAKAYTQKNDIVVQSSGANDPQLLGHEATHVVQQSQMALKPDVNGTPINANRALEKNADDNGERVVRNEPVSVQGVGISGQTVESQTGAIQSKTMTESTMDGTPMQPQATIQRKGLYDLMMGRGSGKFVNSKYKSAQNDKPKQQTSKQAKEKIVDSKYKSAQNNKPKQQTSKPVEEEAKPDSSKTADKGQIVAIIKANPDADAKHLTFKTALKKLKKKKVQGSWVKLVLREMGGIAAPNHREKQIRAIMREKRKGDIPKEFTKFSEFKGTVQEQGQAFRQAEKAYIEGGSAGKDFRQRLLNGELDLRDIQSNSPELRNQVDPTIGIFHTPAEKMTTDLLSGSYKETYPQLAQADMKDLLSIAIYTRGTNNPKKAPYYIINELLRNLDPKTAYDDKFKNDDKSLGIYEPYIMGIASGINNLPPYKGRCFRGGGPPIDIRNKKYQPGKKVKEAGFTSASVAADVTTEFGGNTFYVIDAAGGGAYISPVSEKGDLEAEILFPHNSEFEVRSVYGFDSFKEALSCGHRFFQGTSASDLEQRKPDQIGKVYTGDEVSKAPVMLVHMKEIPTQKQAERANQYQEDNGASTDSYYDPILDIGKHNHLLGDSLQDDSRPPSTFGNEKSDEILALIEEYKAQILTQGITFDDDDDTDVDSNYDEDDMLTRARHNPATSRSGR